jgi:hypothetical protein
MLRSAAATLCATVLVGGCASPVATDAPPPATGGPGPGITAPTETPIATGAATTGAQSPPLATPNGPDLDAHPLVWFTPHPEVRLPDFMKGSSDYFGLFAADSEWTTAAARTQVFKFYDNLGLGREPTDDEFRTAFAGVRDRGLAVALELGPLPHPLAGGSNTDCGDGVEGFSGPFAVQTVQRIKALGDRVDLVAFDEPFAHGQLYEGPNACRWSADKVAAEVVDFVRALREVFPDVVVGDIEPAWAGPLVGAVEVGAWLDAYATAAGEPLGFFHLDVDWARDGWQATAREIEAAVRARGVPFGIIYNGGEEANSDTEWLQLSAERAYEFEQTFGGDPDHVVFQSWHFYPTRALPDSDPAAFTGLINRYFGERTMIELAGPAQAALKTVAGAPVAGAPLALLAQPLDGPLQTLTLDGIVPVGAERAVVVVRVNSEGAGPAPAELNIHEVSYSEDGGQINAVHNPRFRQGLDGWVPFGDGSATVVATHQGTGRMLHVAASPTQSLHIDSIEFDVTPGASFGFEVGAGVPIESADSAYIALIFLATTEIERHILPLAPQPIEVGRVVTDAAGMIELDDSAVEPGRYRLTVDYDGDMQHWPALLERETTIE